LELSHVLIKEMIPKQLYINQWWRFTKIANTIIYYFSWRKHNKSNLQALDTKRLALLKTGIIFGLFETGYIFALVVFEILLQVILVSH